MPANQRFNSSTTYQKFLQTWQGFFPAAAHKIAVAFSGGSDSLALLLLIREWAEESGAELTALTVNHQLRPNMQAELAEISAFLAKEQINHQILTWQPPKNKANIQAKARKARYDLLTKWCQENNYNHLVLAHQQDDQLENFFLRLYHGSGPQGLARIKRETSWNGIKILRPLLDIPKVELQAFLKNNRYEWWEDSSNALPIYERNKIRAQIAGLSHQERKAILTTQDNISALVDYLECQKNEFIATHLSITELGNATLAYTAFMAIDWQLQRLILAEILRLVSGNQEPIREQSLEQLAQALKNQQSKTTLHGVVISRQQGKINFWREEGLIKEPEIMEIDSDYYWDQRFLIENHKNKCLKIIKLNQYNWQQYVKEAPSLKEIKLKRSHIFTLPLIITLENQLLIPHIYNNKVSDITVKFIPCLYAT